MSVIQLKDEREVSLAAGMTLELPPVAASVTGEEQAEMLETHSASAGTGWENWPGFVTKLRRVCLTALVAMTTGTVVASALGTHPDWALGGAFVAGPFAMACGLLWTSDDVKPLSWKKKGIRLAVAAGLSVAILSIAFTNWPLTATFRYSQAEFEALANQVETSRRVVNVPTHCGIFQIKKAEMVRGIPCFWLDLDPAGRTGFVRCSPTNAGLYFNLWSKTRMSSDWTYIKED